jgi:hypothetical protein
MNLNIIDILENYKIALNKINTRLGDGYSSIFNNDLLSLKDYSTIKALVVMDNPGKDEREQKKYLVGGAGKSFNKTLLSLGLVREEILVFNKSTISTIATNDLNLLYFEKRELFLEEQLLTAEVIFKVREILSVPLLLHGYASYLKGNKIYIENEKSNRPLFVFFKLLKGLNNAKEFTYFYKHSSYGNLSKQVSAYILENNLEKISFQQYLDLGRKNAKPFFA